MNALTFIGLVLGVLGSSASAVGSSNLFLTPNQAEKANARAAEEGDGRATVRYRAILDKKAWQKEKLTLIGASAGIVGALMALVGAFIEGWSF